MGCAVMVDVVLYECKRKTEGIQYSRLSLSLSFLCAEIVNLRHSSSRRGSRSAYHPNPWSNSRPFCTRWIDFASASCTVPNWLFRLYCCLELARLLANAALFAGASLLASSLDGAAVAVNVAVDVAAGRAVKASASARHQSYQYCSCCSCCCCFSQCSRVSHCCAQSAIYIVNLLYVLNNASTYNIYTYIHTYNCMYRHAPLPLPVAHALPLLFSTCFPSNPMHTAQSQYRLRFSTLGVIVCFSKEIHKTV